MTKSNALWIGALGLLVAGLAIDRYATSRELTNLHRRYAETAASVADRSSGPDSPEHERSDWQEEPPRAVVGIPPAVASSSSKRQEPTPDTESIKSGEEPLSPLDQAAHIDTVFSSQNSDSGWSRTAEGTLTSALLPLAVGGARIQQVACRTTLCRVKVEHTTDAGIHEFVDHAFRERDYWKGPMVTMRDPSSPKGTFANVIYFSKEGHEIPFAEN